MLLEGTVDGGLYEFNLIKNSAHIDKANVHFHFTQPMSFLSTSFSSKDACNSHVCHSDCALNVWYQRLWHPTYLKVCKYMLFLQNHQNHYAMHAN